MGYVHVVFPERREVFVGDDSQGDNRDEHGRYRTLRVGEGLQTFRLGGPPDYTPPTQTVTVPEGTSAILPFRVVFTKNP